MRFAKERNTGILGACVVHLLLVVFLLLTYIKPIAADLRPDKIEGVPVMFGNVADAFGDDESFGRGDGTSAADVDLSEPNPPSVIAEETRKALPSATTKTPSSSLTQSMEKTIAVKTEAEKKADEKKRLDAIEADRKQREAAEAAKKARAEAEQKDNINKKVGGLLGYGTGSGSRGNTHGSGTQGVPTGNASYGKTSGVGGWGSYDLGGRNVGSSGLVKPTYSVNDYGTVVVDITVDPKGNVISASIGRGTNTPNTTLRNAAIRAAQRTKFNTVSTLGNQKGTITYKFNLN